MPRYAAAQSRKSAANILPKQQQYFKGAPKMMPNPQQYIKGNRTNARGRATVGQRRDGDDDDDEEEAVKFKIPYLSTQDIKPGKGNQLKTRHEWTKTKCFRDDLRI